MQISKSQIKLVRSLQQKKFRDELHLFVAEGDKCIGELMNAFELQMLITEENKSGVDWGREILVASKMEIEQMSSLRTPQGSIAVFRQPDPTFKQPISIPSATLVLALDGIQDPGNLGTIIRTCDWFGVHHVVCSTSTADCYSPKVVQATMGALARVKVEYTNLVDYLSNLPSGTPVYGTLLDGRNLYENNAVPCRDSGVLIMGNEGNGISQEVRRLITHPLYIPSYDSNTVESLNVAVATAVTLAEFRRPNRKQ